MTKIRKRMLAFLAVALSLAFLASGCGSTSNASKPSANQSKALAPYQIVFMYINMGQSQKDLPLVEAAVNKITQAKINATVKLMPLSFPQYNKEMRLMSEGGQKVDLLLTSINGGLSSLVSQGFLVSLNGLLAQDGKGITKAFADDGLSDFLKVGGIINGKCYGIPELRQFASEDCFGVNKNMVAKYHLDVSQVKTVADMTPIFKAVKQQDPLAVPLYLSANPPPAGFVPLSHFDSLGDDIGVLMYGNSVANTKLKVVDLYETPFYANVLKTARAWYKAGYINADAGESMENAQDKIEAGKAFAEAPPPADPGAIAQALGLATPIELLPTSKAVCDTGTVDDLLLSISSNSKNPARVMMFLNMLYTNPQLANLLAWGIEGKDYVKKSGTSVDYPPGVTQNTVGYSHGMGEVADEFLTYTYAPSEPSDLWQQVIAFNKSAARSPALGFLFNPDPVKTQYAAVTNVVDQYARQLQTGSVDPNKVLPQFVAKLKAAGIDQVIAEKQKQLDAWVQKQSGGS